MEGGIGEGELNNFLKAARWALQNVLQFFVLIEIFEN